jgi:hypothetical protein
LGIKNIQAKVPASIVEAETYWKPLWTEEALHNERSIWIRRKEKRKFIHMNWRRIQISEHALQLLKAHNWK